MAVLEQIGAGPENNQKILEVWNKADLLNDDDLSVIEKHAETSSDSEQAIEANIISCQTGYGIEALLETIERILTESDEVVEVEIQPRDFKVRAWLHENGQVLEEETGENGSCHMKVVLSDPDIGKLKARHPDVLKSL